MYFGRSLYLVFPDVYKLMRRMWMKMVPKQRTISGKGRYIGDFERTCNEEVFYE